MDDKRAVVGDGEAFLPERLSLEPVSISLEEYTAAARALEQGRILASLALPNQGDGTVVKSQIS